MLSKFRNISNSCSRFRSIFNEGLDLFKEHRKKVDKIIDRARRCIDNINNDEFVNRLRERLSCLSDDLFWKDQNGRRYFDAEAAGILGSSITNVIKDEFK